MHLRADIVGRQRGLRPLNFFQTLYHSDERVIPVTDRLHPTLT